jgi:uncharacterized membrane protein YtjA (UPF0391 family)
LDLNYCSRTAACHGDGDIGWPKKVISPRFFHSAGSSSFTQEEKTMLRFAFLFLIIALIAGALGIYPVAGISYEIAWICFVIFLVLFVVSLVFGGIRSGPRV